MRTISSALAAGRDVRRRRASSTRSTRPTSPTSWPGWSWPTRRRSPPPAGRRGRPSPPGPRYRRRCAGQVVASIGRIVAENTEALARLVTREVGKPLAEARGEVQEIVDTCDFFLGEGRRLYGETVPSEMPDKQLFTFRVPVGVAAVITAGNFPVAVPSWYLVPALLCGNAVVWKPAEYAAASRPGDVRAVRRGRPARRRAAGGAGRRCVHVRRSGRGAGRAAGRQGRLHRVHCGR